MTSLQLAAGKGTKKTTNQNKPKQVGGNGLFENSFQGLDLSEFSSSITTTTSKSASAQLLLKKQMEAQTAYEEEQEEVRMRDEAFARAKKQCETIKQQQQTNKSENHNALFSALISMHKGDTNSGVTVGKKKNIGKKSQKQRKRNNANVTTITKSSGKKITRRSKGIKY